MCMMMISITHLKWGDRRQEIKDTPCRTRSMTTTVQLIKEDMRTYAPVPDLTLNP